MVRYKVKPDRGAESEELVRGLGDRRLGILIAVTPVLDPRSHTARCSERREEK
jgi:hypothetical protein